MNFPVPRPPKQKLTAIVTDAVATNSSGTPKVEETKRKKMVTYICTLPNDRVVEVRADSPDSVVSACMARHKMRPVEFRKKPFEHKEHLTTRALSNHPGLVDLKKQLSKDGAKK